MKNVFERQIGGTPDLELAEKRAKELWKLAFRAANGEIEAEEMESLCRDIMKNQMLAAKAWYGLWPVLLTKDMPSEACADFIYRPSAAVCGILLVAVLAGYTQKIPGLNVCLQRGLDRTFPRGEIASHGYEQPKEEARVIELLTKCGLGNYLDSTEFCAMRIRRKLWWMLGWKNHVALHSPNFWGSSLDKKGEFGNVKEKHPIKEG